MMGVGKTNFKGDIKLFIVIFLSLFVNREILGATGANNSFFLSFCAPPSPANQTYQISLNDIVFQQQSFIGDWESNWNRSCKDGNPIPCGGATINDINDGNDGFYVRGGKDPREVDAGKCSEGYFFVENENGSGTGTTSALLSFNIKLKNMCMYDPFTGSSNCSGVTYLYTGDGVAGVSRGNAWIASYPFDTRKPFNGSASPQNLISLDTSKHTCSYVSSNTHLGLSKTKSPAECTFPSQSNVPAHYEYSKASKIADVPTYCVPIIRPSVPSSEAKR